MQQNGSDGVYCWTIRDVWISIPEHTHYSVCHIPALPGQVIRDTMTTLHKWWEQDWLIWQFCNKEHNEQSALNTFYVEDENYVSWHKNLIQLTIIKA